MKRRPNSQETGLNPSAARIPLPVSPAEKKQEEVWSVVSGGQSLVVEMSPTPGLVSSVVSHRTWDNEVSNLGNTRTNNLLTHAVIGASVSYVFLEDGYWTVIPGPTSTSGRTESTPTSDFYKREEDIPLSDQGLNIGETFVAGASPNWSFVPPSPEAQYKDAGRTGQESHNTASLSGEAGRPPELPGELLPNIDFEFVIKMERMETGLDPCMRVTVDVTHNQYPAYDAIIRKADGTYEHVYRVEPPASTLPGPISLNSDQTGTGGPLDIHKSRP